MTLATIFLVTVAIMFTSPAMELFGQSLYLVKSNSFDLIRAPSIVIGAKTDPAELGAGDIVIFDNKTTVARGKSIGEITEAASRPDTDDDESEGRLFKIRSEAGTVNDVYEQDIISKAVRTSRAFGIIINFAASPVGVLVIAVIPCICIILGEVLKPVFRKKRDKLEVSPVNKQDEVPTFIPGVHAEKSGEKSGKSAAALKAYKETLKITNTGEIDELPQATPQLFTAPEKTTMTKKSTKKPPPPSSVKLAEVIATASSNSTSGKGANDDSESLEELTAAEKAARISQAMAAAKAKMS